MDVVGVGDALSRVFTERVTSVWPASRQQSRRSGECIKTPAGSSSFASFVFAAGLSNSGVIDIEDLGDGHQRPDDIVASLVTPNLRNECPLELLKR